MNDPPHIFGTIFLSIYAMTVVSLFILWGFRLSLVMTGMVGDRRTVSYFCRYGLPALLSLSLGLLWEQIRSSPLWLLGLTVLLAVLLARFLRLLWSDSKNRFDRIEFLLVGAVISMPYLISSIAFVCFQTERFLSSLHL